MPQPVLRRPDIPRLHVTMPCTSALPGFLHPERAVPMVPAPVTGPHDALEAAILRGAVWDTGADPIEIDGFDPEQDVISVFVEESDGALELDVQNAGGAFHILANGRTMAKVAALKGRCARPDIRVLQSRH